MGIYVWHSPPTSLKLQALRWFIKLFYTEKRITEQIVYMLPIKYTYRNFIVCVKNNAFFADLWRKTSNLKNWLNLCIYIYIFKYINTFLSRVSLISQKLSHRAPDKQKEGQADMAHSTQLLALFQSI